MKNRADSLSALFTSALVYGAILTAAIAVFGGLAAWIFAGWEGLWGMLLGSILAMVFVGATIVSILLANRFRSSPIFTNILFIAVMGGWLVKAVVFMAFAFALKGQPWFHAGTFFIGLLLVVAGTLTIDIILIARSRIAFGSM